MLLTSVNQKVSAIGRGCAGIVPLALIAALAAPTQARSTAQAASPAAAPPIATPASEAQPDPADDHVESLRNAIVAALKQNPEIQIALAREDDAKYAIDEARAAYLPRLDVTMASGPEYNLPNANNTTLLRRSEGVINLHQNVWDFGVTINDIKRARAAHMSAKWGTRQQIEQISYDMSVAYLSVLEKQRLVALIEDEIETQNKMSNMITVQKDLGLTTAADVSRAQVRGDALRQQLLDAHSQLQQQREASRRLTGHLPGRAVSLPPVDPALPADAETAVDLMETHSPQLAQAMQDRRSIDRQLASQRGNFFPKIALDVQGNYKDEVLGRTGRNEDARVVLTMTYNIFNGGADLALKRRIQARLREADYQMLKIRRDVEQDLRIDYQSLAAANEKVATIQSQVAAAEKVVTLYREQFRSGTRSVFDLLDSQQALFQARQNELTNYTQKQASGFRVLQKISGLFDLVSQGEPLPNIVVQPPTKK